MLSYNKTRPWFASSRFYRASCLHSVGKIIISQALYVTYSAFDTEIERHPQTRKSHRLYSYRISDAYRSLALYKRRLSHHTFHPMAVSTTRGLIRSSKPFRDTTRGYSASRTQKMSSSLTIDRLTSLKLAIILRPTTDLSVILHSNTWQPTDLDVSFHQSLDEDQPAFINNVSDNADIVQRSKNKCS